MGGVGENLGPSGSAQIQGSAEHDGETLAQLAASDAASVPISSDPGAGQIDEYHQIVPFKSLGIVAFVPKYSLYIAGHTQLRRLCLLVALPAFLSAQGEPERVFLVSPSYIGLPAPYFTTIQPAIDEAQIAGGVVKIGPGTYPLSGPLIIDSSNVSLCGEGPTTILSLVNEASGETAIYVNRKGFYENHAGTQRLRNITIRDLRIEANGLHQTGNYGAITIVLCQ